MGWLGAWFSGLAGRRDDRALPLYNAVVRRAREPHWYLEGGAPDTVDGRFDMVAAILSAVLLRLEGDPAAAEPSARLTERFVEDMDGQLRQMGIGDIVVGKHIGRMMSMLGGRLGAYRDGFASAPADGGAGLREAVARNVFRGAPADPAPIARGLLDLRDRLATTPTDALLAGELP